MRSSLPKKKYRESIYTSPLHDLRQERHINQESVAAAIGVSVRSYGEWERGFIYPEPDNLLKLAKYFSVSTDYLLGATPYRNIGNREAMKITGLSEESIEALRSLYVHPQEDAENLPFGSMSLSSIRSIEKIFLMRDELIKLSQEIDCAVSSSFISSKKSTDSYNELNLALSTFSGEILDRDDHPFGENVEIKDGLISLSSKEAAEWYSMRAYNRLFDLARKCVKETISESAAAMKQERDKTSAENKEE